MSLKIAPKDQHNTPQPVAKDCKRSGFTLIELLVTIGIVAILVALAIPSFTQSKERSIIDSVQQNLLDSITLAQSEALKRGFEVTVCASSTGTSCSTSSGAWLEGWLVLATTDEEGKSLSASDPNAILQTIKAPDNLRINASRASTSFRSDGTASQPLAFIVCPMTSTSSITPKKLFVNFAGRALINSDSVTLSCT